MTAFATRAIRAAADSADALTATDVILCRNLQTTRLGGDYQLRDFATGLQGAQIEELRNAHAGASFEVEAATGGAAGTAPGYGHLLQACGLTETVVATTSVSYTPTPMGTAPAEERLELVDGNTEQVIRKARGALSFNAEVNRTPFFGLSFLGRYGAPVAGAAAGGDFSGWRQALECAPGNMGAVTFAGVALCLRSLSITDGRTPRIGKFMTCEGTDITPRRFTGRMTLQWPAHAALDVLEKCRLGTTSALSWTLGTQAANILTVHGPAVQIKYGGEQDIDGVLGVNLDLVFTPDQGDDEIAFIFT